MPGLPNGVQPVANDPSDDSGFATVHPGSPTGSQRPDRSGVPGRHLVRTLRAALAKLVTHDWSDPTLQNALDECVSHFGGAPIDPAYPRDPRPMSVDDLIGRYWND